MFSGGYKTGLALLQTRHIHTEVSFCGYHRGPFQFFANLTKELSGITCVRLLKARSIQAATWSGDSLQRYILAKPHSML